METSTYLTDEQSRYQLVGNIVDRRDGRELRKSLRFPLDETHTEGTLYRCKYGSIFLKQTAEESFPDLPGNRKQGNNGSGADSSNHFSIIDFSEGGVQVEFAGGNPMDFIGKPIRLEICKLRIPVSLRWYKPAERKSRAGFAFEKSISSSLDTATLAVRLSDMLLDSLTSELLQMSTGDKYRYSYYVLLVFLSNLRLKLLQSFAHYFEVRSLLNNGMEPSSPGNGNCRVLRYQEDSSQHATLREIAAGDSRFKDIISTFMIPYSRYGCTVMTHGDSQVMLEKEIVSTLARTVFIPNGHLLSKGNGAARLESAYANFMKLHTVVPEMFIDIEADKQLLLYGNMIDSIDNMTEKAIDRLSGSRSI